MNPKSFHQISIEQNPSLSLHCKPSSCSSYFSRHPLSSPPLQFSLPPFISSNETPIRGRKLQSPNLKYLIRRVVFPRRWHPETRALAERVSWQCDSSRPQQGTIALSALCL
ncbi:hypothetical protein LINGRAPRIM_LOCUS2394 [Linum grandiflorum]